MKPRQSILLAASTLLVNPVMAAGPTEIAYDMVGSNSLNLEDFTNAFAGVFSSSADGSQKYERGVSAYIPYVLLDDTLSSYPADDHGIIDDTNLDEFFGIADSDNNDNPGGETVATWTFNISNSTDLSVAIDIGAMGDFESSDTFSWTARIDDGSVQPLFSTTTNEAGSKLYTLASGTEVTLPDPLEIGTTGLSNILTTFTAPVSGAGDCITISFHGNTNGSDEALVFQNLKILSDSPSSPDPVDCETTPPTGPALTLIHDIQGSGASTPMPGNEVIIKGVVVGDFQDYETADNGDLNGFYVQEEDADADADPSTSEGIFVYDASGIVDVEVGQLVTVTGSVSEYSDQTQISASDVSIVSASVPLPTPAFPIMPVAGQETLEPYESMLVRFTQTLVISEYYNYDRYGEIVLALPIGTEERPFSPTAVEIPGTPAQALRADTNLMSRIILDDGLTVQNPDTNRHPNGLDFGLSNVFRGGDHITDLLGVLDYRYDEFRVQPTGPAGYAAMNPRPFAPPSVGGNLKVASFNVLNYFTTLDDNGWICGPSAALECRGADNATEFTRQRDKIIAALAELDADIVGLIEIENNDAAIADLVAGLNATLGSYVYSLIDTGPIGNDAIKVGFIYKHDIVTPSGPYAILDSTVDPLFIDTRNRPALAQTFEEVVDGSRFTAVVNHFKSKGSSCSSIGDPDSGDGQGNCNGTRTDAATAMTNWLLTDPTSSGDPDYLIIGDLNAYDMEDPITTLELGGFTDLIKFFSGDFAYSYVFDGQFGYLDHGLANTSLVSQVTGTDIWQINADEADLLDYDISYKSDSQDAIYEPTAFRSSDHDPVLIGLNLNAPPQCDVAYPSEDIIYHRGHKFVPVTIEGLASAKTGSVEVEITSVFQDEPVTSRRDKTSPDAMIPGGNLVNLRGEHSQLGEKPYGRVYHIFFTATSAGGSCEGKIVVGVAKRRNKNAPFPHDNGPVFSSTAEDY